jgi:hypothetical protein
MIWLFANTTVTDMLEHIFLSYESITAVDLEHNFENMSKAWDPQQNVENLFNQIQDCRDNAEAGGVTIGKAHTLRTAYAKVFYTGNFHSKCHHWKQRDTPDKTWDNFKIHFTAAYRQHKQMQGETAAASGYVNADISQPVDDDLSEAAIAAFANSTTSSSVDRGIVATLTDTNYQLSRQLEISVQALEEISALLKK